MYYFTDMTGIEGLISKGLIYIKQALSVQVTLKTYWLAWVRYISWHSE